MPVTPYAFPSPSLLKSVYSGYPMPVPMLHHSSGLQMETKGTPGAVLKQLQPGTLTHTWSPSG